MSTQDKILARLRALCTSLTPDLHRPVREALLSLLAQPGFIKKVMLFSGSRLLKVTRHEPIRMRDGVRASALSLFGRLARSGPRDASETWM